VGGLLLILDKIDGIILKDMIISAANNLENYKNVVNELNVFPVPDGDTGTNMSLTLSAAAREIKQKNDTSVSVIADILASASLRGARGNSGVILSQLFRGFSKELKGYSTVDAVAFAKALKSGVDTAYRAVMKPTEGTILTVARESARCAVEVSENFDNIVYVLEQTIKQANDTLQKTPDMLPALKQAGVVDAGGKGLVFIMEGALHVLKYGKIIEKSEYQAETEKQQEKKEHVEVDGNIEFSYCTEFLINKSSADIDINKYKEVLQKLGDSMLVIDDEQIIKTHIHTNNPGIVIEEALKLGWLTSIKIDNMKEQHQHIIAPKESQAENKKYGFIAVAIGDGIVRVLKDMGVDEVIEGGQTMNPSTDDILNAVNKLNADTIYVLPNNKNIILAAEQSKTLTDKNLIVVPTKSIPQGIACMLAFNPSDEADKNLENMISALESVKTGQITYAVRDSKFEDKEIKEGNILGMIDGKISIVGDDIQTTCNELLELMVDEDSSVITIFYGADTDMEEAQKLAEYAEEKFPDCDIELHNGGQPLYYYLISVE